MELKFHNIFRILETTKSSNRTFMELKLKVVFQGTTLNFVLIVPLWN